MPSISKPDFLNKIPDPTLPYRCGSVALRFNALAPRVRWGAIFGVFLFFLVLIIAIAASGGPVDADQAQLTSLLSSSGAVDSAKQTVAPNALGASTQSMLAATTGSQAPLSLKYTTEVANPDTAALFAAFNRSSAPSTEYAHTPTAGAAARRRLLVQLTDLSSPQLSSAYAIKVYTGTTDLLGMAKVPFTVALLLPRGAKALSSVIMLLLLRVNTPTFSLANSLPNAAALMPSNGWLAKVQFLASNGALSLMLASHDVSTAQVFAMAGVNFAATVERSMLSPQLLGQRFMSLSATHARFNAFLPTPMLAAVAASLGVNVSNAQAGANGRDAWFKYGVGTVGVGNAIALRNTALTLHGTGATNPPSTFSTDVRLAFPAPGAFASFHLFGRYLPSGSGSGGGGGVLRLNGTLLSYSLTPPVDAVLSLSRLSLQTELGQGQFGLQGLYLQGAGQIKTNPPLDVSVSGQVTQAEMETFVYLQAVVSAGSSSPADMLCALGKLCSSAVRGPVSALGLDSLELVVRVSYNTYDTGTLQVHQGMVVFARAAMDWSKWPALAPLRKLFDLSRVTVNAGVEIPIFNPGQLSKLQLFFAFTGVKFKDPSWNARLTFDRLALKLAPLPVPKIGVLAKMTYMVRSGEFLAFQFLITADATLALTATASMRGLWVNAFGVNALTFGNIGMTIGFRPGPTVITVDRLGMTGELYIGKAVFRGHFLVTPSAPPSVSGEITNLALSDLFDWALNITGKSPQMSWSKLPKWAQNLFSTVRINAAKFRFASTSGFIGNVPFSPGYYIKLNIALMGGQFSASFGILDVSIGNGATVKDLVLGFKILNFSPLSSIASGIIAPAKGMSRDYINSRTSLSLRYPCGVNLGGVKWCTKTQSFGVGELVTRINNLDLSTVFAIRELGFNDFGLVSSFLTGKDPRVVAAVTLGGVQYNWVGSIPLSAVAGPAKDFTAAAIASLKSLVASAHKQLVINVLVKPLCSALGKKCIGGVSAFGASVPGVCLSSLFPMC